MPEQAPTTHEAADVQLPISNKMRCYGESRARRGSTWPLLLIMLSILGTQSIARAEVVSLQTLERKALEGREMLEIDSARARGAEADARKAAASRYPRFALKAESTLAPGRQLINVYDTRAVRSNGQIDRDADSYLIQASPSLSQGADAFKPQLRNGVELSGEVSLYDFGRSKAAMEAGRASQAAFLAQGAVTRADIVRGVRASYLSWLSAHQMAQLADQTARDAAQRHERVAALIQEGVRPTGDLTPARADELLTKLELERAQGELASARLSLEQAVGVPLSPDAEPDLELLQARDETPSAGGVTDPAAVALSKQHAAALALVHTSKKQDAPDLSLGVSVGVRNQLSADASKVNNVFPLYGAALTLTVPLWDGGLTSASVEGARARAGEIDAQRRAHEKARDHAGTQAALASASARSQLITAEELLQVCAERLKQTEEGYELGVTSIDAISQARTLLRRAQSEVLRAKIAHSEAALRMAPIATAP